VGESDGLSHPSATGRPPGCWFWAFPPRSFRTNWLYRIRFQVGSIDGNKKSPRATLWPAPWRPPRLKPSSWRITPNRCPPCPGSES